MVFHIENGKCWSPGTLPRNGFTLLELLVVVAIVTTLLTIAVPRYLGAVDRARDAVLRENLSSLRDAIDKYYSDQGRYPDKLEDLVGGRYLRNIPLDPVTESRITWILIAPPSAQAGKVYDVRSGAPGKSRDGIAYSTL